MLFRSERLAGVVMVDSLLPGLPPERATASQGRARQYATIADALVRFRFLPEQGSKMPFVVDLMARGGLRRVEQADGGHHFAWCFDPELWPKLRAGSPYIGLPGQVTLPAALIYGEHSAVVSPDRLDAALKQFDDCRAVIAIPDAEHHVMADQPLALIAAIEQVLADFSGQP